MSTDYREYINAEQFLANADLAKGLPFINRFMCEMTVGKEIKKSYAFHILSCDVPSFTIGVNEQELFGEKRFSFSKREDGDLGITYLETPDLRFRDIFYEWMKKAVNITGYGDIKRQYPDTVAQDSIIRIFPLDNTGQALVCDKFESLIPYDISGISYTYSDTEIIKTTVKFKYKYHRLVQLP